MKDLKEAYKTIEADHFAPKMEISFITGDKRETLSYEKVTWNIGGEEKGLRYGENPGQEAALYKLVNGNIVLGDCTQDSWLSSIKTYLSTQPYVQQYACDTTDANIGYPSTFGGSAFTW